MRDNHHLHGYHRKNVQIEGELVIIYDLIAFQKHGFVRLCKFSGPRAQSVHRIEDDSAGDRLGAGFKEPKEAPVKSQGAVSG